MPLVEPEIDYIDKKSRTIKYKGGIEEPLSEEANFALFATPYEKQTKERTKQSELNFAESVGEGSQTFLKTLGDNFISKAITDYALDPAIASARAITPGEGQEDQGFLDRMVGNYRAQRMGRREAIEEMQKRNPKATTAGTIGSIGLDIASPLPGALARRPVAAGALLGGLSSDRSLLEDPGKVAKSSAIGAGIGAAVGGLERVARERGALRAHPEEVRMTHDANSRAMQDYRAELSRKLGAISKDIPAGGIDKSVLGIPEFINTNIKMSGGMASAEAKGATNILEAIESGLPNKLSAKDIERAFDVIEQRIALGASAEEAAYLNRFKEHLVNVVPTAAGEMRAVEKFFPKILRQFDKNLQKSIGAMTADTEIMRVVEKKLGRRAAHDLHAGIMTSLDEGLSKMTPAQLVKAPEDGSLPQIMMEMMQNSTQMSALEQMIDNTIRKMEPLLNTAPRSRLTQISSDLDSLRQAQLYLEKINQDAMMMSVDAVNKYARDLKALVIDSRDKIGSKISNAVGVQNPFISTNIPPTNMRPNLAPPPPAPQVGGTAAKFENPNYYADQARSLGSVKSLGALGGAVFGMGVPKAAAGAAVLGYQGLQSALRGITRPDAIGNFARRSIQRGGVDLILEQIKSYPSYRDGILLDPQDRRSAVAEIEVDQDLPMEDKAVLQAKINRGLSLEKYIEGLNSGE